MMVNLQCRRYPSKHWEVPNLRFCLLVNQLRDQKRFQENRSIYQQQCILPVFAALLGLSMWSINDADGPLITERFYKQLFYPGAPSPRSEDTAYALHQAILDLRREGAISMMGSAQFVHYGV